MLLELMQLPPGRKELSMPTSCFSGTLADVVFDPTQINTERLKDPVSPVMSIFRTKLSRIEELVGVSRLQPP
jgi:hypothetical protein